MLSRVTRHNLLHITEDLSPNMFIPMPDLLPPPRL